MFILQKNFFTNTEITYLKTLTPLQLIGNILYNYFTEIQKYSTMLTQNVPYFKHKFQLMSASCPYGWVRLLLKYSALKYVTISGNF